MALVVNAIALALSIPSWAQETQPQLLALEDLFPGSLFPDDDAKPSADLPSGDSFFSSSPIPAKKTTPNSQANRMQQENDREADSTMRQQIDKVSSWLQEFSLRNHGNFPGVASDFGSPIRASQVQLTELVGANPYAGSMPASSPYQELNGLGPGLSSSYSNDGNPSTASPVESDEWTAELQAQKSSRVRLGMDYSISASEIDQWRSEAPSEWQAAPGTIYANGNYQGLFYVWGAGRDGKPVKDSSGSQAYISTGRTGATSQDQIAPNEGL